jgi:hypothetical protein
MISISVPRGMSRRVSAVSYKSRIGRASGVFWAASREIFDADAGGADCWRGWGDGWFAPMELPAARVADKYAGMFMSGIQPVFETNYSSILGVFG